MDSPFSSRISTIIALINANYREEIPLSGFARICSLSRFHLERVFKGEAGIPIKKFVILRRMAEAARLLRSGTKRSVIQVCFDVGFNDLSNFTRRFKKYVGCPPLAYKNCSRDPETCELRRNSYINYLGSIKDRIWKALAIDLSKLCYMNRAI
jgi:AraC-like DNA-binding protein